MPPPIQIDDDSEVKGDMTPMIDIIFLLLIFFILTTKFIPEEKMIASILPTNKGQSSAQQDIEPPENFNILIYPTGFQRGMGVQDMHEKWMGDGYDGDAVLRVSNLEPMVVTGERLSSANKDQANSELAAIHGYIGQHLRGFEQGDKPRDEQDPVIIHCFSGLSWKFALAAYDAVRAYERDQAGVETLTPEALANAREVTFAPPRVRDFHEWEMGKELWEIIHMK